MAKNSKRLVSAPTVPEAWFRYQLHAAACCAASASKLLRNGVQRPGGGSGDSRVRDSAAC
jgi:hypothetical protein